MLAKLTQASLYANSAVKELIETGGSMIENFVEPKDHCCLIYKDTNYGHQLNADDQYCHTGPGYTNFDVWHDGFNDMVSSWQCGKNVRYDFCFDHTVTDKCPHDGN